MTTQEVKRKLTAIFSADVKGYSRLMGEDEKGTVRILNAYKEVITGIIQHHHGRVVDASGDNVLADRQEEARSEAAEVLRQYPEFSLERFAKTFPWKNKDDVERYIIEPLRKAGLK